MLRAASVANAILIAIVSSTAQAGNPTQFPPKATAAVLEHIQSSVGMMEALACAFVIAFVYVYIKGQRVNDDIAKSWFKTIYPILELQFAKVGAYHGATTKSILLKDSASTFRVYASGRRNCNGMLASIDLKKRQDLLALILEGFGLAPSNDRCILEIPFDSDTMEPFVFVVCKKRDEKKLRKEHKDIEQFLVKPLSVPALNSKGLTVLSESSEVLGALLDNRIVKVLCDIQGLFISLHISDAISIPNILSLSMLRFEFKVPPAHSMHQVKKIVEMSLFLADQIASIKLTSQARSRAMSIRFKIAQAHRKQTHEERQELIQRKKLEALEQQRNALSGEALLQFEERQQKLSMKRRGPRMKIMR